MKPLVNSFGFPNQQRGYPTWLYETSNSNQTRETASMLRPIPNPKQGHTSTEIHHPYTGRELAQVTQHETHDSHRHERGIPEHSINFALFFDDNHVHTLGRYRWTRLPFEISSASEEWQRRIHMVLEGLKVISIADDILVPGCGKTEKEAQIDYD